MRTDVDAGVANSGTAVAPPCREGAAGEESAPQGQQGEGMGSLLTWVNPRCTCYEAFV